MSRFEPGQPLVCIRKHPWNYGFGPKYGDIVHVEKYGVRRHGLDGERLSTHHWIYLKEWQEIGETGHRIAYACRFFRPVITDSILSEALESITQTQEA